MPIKIPDNLPAAKVLEKERIPVIRSEKALRQDIRPLNLAILNLMPDKIQTENQLLRALGSTPLQIEISLIRTGSYEGKNTEKSHLHTFYDTWEHVSHRKFDGLIVTGAPVENMDYEKILYWKEMQEILNWTLENVYSTFYICWAAQAALYHFYGLQKETLPKKIMGNYKHLMPEKFDPLTAGFDDVVYIPLARQTTIPKQEINKVEKMEILLEHEDSGPCLLQECNHRRVYMFNHLEYDRDTLKNEYLRDMETGMYDVDLPVNYFPDNDMNNDPKVNWRAHRNLLFGNWINIVYQNTPFNPDDIEPLKTFSDLEPVSA